MAELIAGMFTASRYKRSQGKIARQLTWLALAAAIGVGAWQLGPYLGDWLSRAFGVVEKGVVVRSELAGSVGRFAIPLAIAAVGAWAAFRVVNIPRFADFLISVEAEMNKVSWPSRSELFRASMVVIVVIFLLTLILLLYDVVLKAVVGWLLG